MDWSYVAGYFDGEGHVAMHMCARKKKTTALSWHNSHLESLEAMRDFMQAGNITMRLRSNRHKAVYVLSVTWRADTLRVLNEMIPHLIIKREPAEQLRYHLLNFVKDQSPNFGKVAAVSTEQLIQWYHDEGKSYAEIGRIVGVHPTAVAQAFRVRGISARPAGGSHWHGQPKSEETRRRMKESRRKMWEDPEFRAANLKNLAKGREALQKKHG